MSNDSISLSTSPNTALSPENVNSIPCGACRRQFSKYACPKCNLPYCSLTCFRSPVHAECSESFYRQELETDIRVAPSKTTEERREMIELLKRFEEDAQNDDLELLKDSGSDIDDENDLASRLADIDLERVSYDEIWSKLTPTERNKFLSALNDPSSELAQQLLASEELERQTTNPWWERPKHENENEPTRRLRNADNYGHRPEFVEIPPTAIRASETAGIEGPSLLYNICAVFISYAYVTRHLCASPISTIPLQDDDNAEARKWFSRLVPFLTDRKSRTVLPSLSAVITDLWSRFAPEAMTPSFFSLLMRDTAKLLRPASVVSISSETEGAHNTTHDYITHHSADALRTLSDISALFQGTAVAPKGRAVSAVSAKLAFYSARIMVTPSYILKTLADELVSRARLLEREGELSGDLADAKDGKEMPAPSNENIQKEGERPRIEELT